MNLSPNGFCSLSEPQNENKRKKKDKQLVGPCQRTEMSVELKGDVNINCNLYTWNRPQRLGRETEGFGEQRKEWNYLDHGMVKILAQLAGKAVEYTDCTSSEG